MKKILLLPETTFIDRPSRNMEGTLPGTLRDPPEVNLNLRSPSGRGLRADKVPMSLT